MGKGEIVSQIGAGQYTVKLLYSRGRLDAEIAKIDATILRLEALIIGMEAGLERDIQIAFLESYKKKKDYLQDNMPADPVQTVWCADFTTNLSPGTVVGTVEVPGEVGSALIRPGWNGGSAYNAARDGQLFPSIAQTATGVFTNWALLPHWQKFKPTHRFGQITSIDHLAKTATISLSDAESSAQSINVNLLPTLEDVTFRYMSCDDGAFAVGDYVLIEFTNQSWEQPVIVGFQTDPKMCGFFCLAYADGDLLRFRVNEFTRSIDLESALRTKHLALGFSAGAFAGFSNVLAVNFADSWPFRIGVLVEMAPSSGTYAAGRYAVVMVSVSITDLAMSIEAVYYYSLLQDLGDGFHRIAACTGEWASTETDPDDLPIDLADIPHENTCVKLLASDCEAGQRNTGTNCHTYQCCHRYYCPSTGEYADCSADPCNGDCVLEHNGAPAGSLWCSSWIGAECIDLQNHFITCEDALSGDPCGFYSYNYDGCNAETCETWEVCGSSLVTVTPEEAVVPDDCAVSGGLGPVPVALAFSKESLVPTVYLAGQRETTGLDQTFGLAGTQCTQQFEECGDCTMPWAGPAEENLLVHMPPGLRANPGWDLWKADAPDLYGEFNVGTRLAVIPHDGYVSRTTSRGGCSSNETTINALVLSNFLGLGLEQFAYNAIRGLYNYYNPGGWEYENLGLEPETYGLAFSFPDTPEGEDPDNGDWIMFNTIRDSLQAPSLIYDWGSEYFRSTNSLGHNLALTPGLETPLDDSNRVACLVSSRDDEGNPGFAICTSAAKILCFAGWVVHEAEGGEVTLSPSGTPAYTWDVALPLSDWRKAAFFCGNVPGVVLPS